MATGLVTALAVHSAAARADEPKPEKPEFGFEVTGQGQRIAPLSTAEFTDAMWQALQTMDGVSVEPSISAKKQGEISNMFATMVRHPQLYEKHLALARQLLRTGLLSTRDRELAILTVGWLSQAPYEWGQHVSIAKRAGFTDQDFARLTVGSNAEGWSDHDRLIVRAAEELHYRSMISDDTWHGLADNLSDEQLIELVMLVGQYKTVAYYQNSLRLDLPEGNDGLRAR